MYLTIGVDVGNYDTKTRSTTTTSGYTPYDNEQLLADKVLYFNNKYYVENIDNRMPFVEDKTDNDQCLILTLFAIAKEMIYRAQHDSKYVGSGNIQAEIQKIDSVNLAFGLPPGHFNKLARKTLEYYKSKMKDGVRFSYCGYKFSFKLGICEAYAQDLAAVIMNKDITINNPETGYSKYYIVGIGGYTVDVIPISDGKPEIDSCRSLSLGTRPMYEDIITRVQSVTAKTLSEKAIEDILRGRKSIMAPDVIETVKKTASTHADKIINRCIQANCSFDEYPVVYYGGGCLLLKEYLKRNKLVVYSEFIEDVRANATNFEEFLRRKHKLTV